jgi:CDP-diacylglycerol---glycerol-3-phosphate 3-phosphatidyltransferase
MFTQKFQAWVRRWAERGVGVFRNSPITPNMLTLFGLLITGLGAAAIALNHLFTAGLVLWFAGAFDILDGALARASGRVYRYGAFFDSTVDRYSESVVYLGLLVYFLERHLSLEPVLVLVALAGSFLVSYVRARAQSLGFTCDAGILARPERVVVIVAGLLLERIHLPGWHFTTLTLALWILAIGTNLTAIQRVWVVWQQNRAELRASRSAAASAVPGPAPDRERPVRTAMRRFFETWLV